MRADSAQGRMFAIADLPDRVNFIRDIRKPGHDLGRVVGCVKRNPLDVDFSS